MNQTKKVFSDLILNHLKDGVYFGKKVFRDEGIQRPIGRNLTFFDKWPVG